MKPQLPIKLKESIDSRKKTIAQHVSSDFGINTEFVRRYANEIDGVQFVNNLLAAEGLLNATKVEELREALKITRYAHSASFASSQPGFADGVWLARVLVASELENHPRFKELT